MKKIAKAVKCTKPSVKNTFNKFCRWRKKFILSLLEIAYIPGEGGFDFIVLRSPTLPFYYTFYSNHHGARIYDRSEQAI